MAITQAMPTSFKVEILDGIHNFGTGVVRATTAADTFKMALYTSSATLDASTTVYSSSNEVSSVNYTAGGLVLIVSVVPTSGGTTAYLSFSIGALIYNSTQGNKAVAVLSFGGTQTVSGGDFNVIFPAAGSTTAILRIE